MDGQDNLGLTFYSSTAELGALPGLKKLWLSQNELTGTIPLELALLPSASGLEEFVVNGNYLSGMIPDELCVVKIVEHDCDPIRFFACNCTCGDFGNNTI